MAVEQVRLVEVVVDEAALLAVHPLHCRKATGGLDPVVDLSAHVDAERVGRVQHRALLGLLAIVEVGGAARQGRAVLDEVIAHDDHRDAGAPGVLLRACVDQAVACDVDGLGQKAARDVRDERDLAGLGQLVVLGAKDRVVLADVDVVVARGLGQLAHARHLGDAVEARVLARGERVYLSVLARLALGLGGEVARDEVAGPSAFHEVHGDAGELQRGASLQEQHAVVARDVRDAAQRCLRVVEDLLVGARSVAHLQHAHATAVVVEHLGRALGEHALGQRRRACREVEDSSHTSSLPLAPRPVRPRSIHPRIPSLGHGMVTPS